MVVHGDTGDHRHHDGQRGAPAGRSRGRVGEREAGRRGVVHFGDRADIVVHPYEQTRLDPAGEIEEEHRRPTGALHVTAVQDTAGAGTEQVDDPQAVRDSRGWGALDRDRVAPAVSAVVEPHRHAVVVDIDQVVEPVPVDVAEKHPGRVVPVGQPADC